MIIFCEDQDIVPLRQRQPSVDRSVVLVQHSNRAHFKADINFRGGVYLGIIKALPDRPTANRAALEPSSKPLMALLSQQRKIKMLFEEGRLLFKIDELFFQKGLDLGIKPAGSF